MAAGAGALARGNGERVARPSRSATPSGKLSTSSTAGLRGRLGRAGCRQLDSAAAGARQRHPDVRRPAASLASGSASLSTSASSANHGAQSLSSGLAKGAKESPTYSDPAADGAAPTVSQPAS